MYGSKEPLNFISLPLGERGRIGIDDGLISKLK